MTQEEARKYPGRAEKYHGDWRVMNIFAPIMRPVSHLCLKVFWYGH